MAMEPFFDACVLAAEAGLGEAPKLPAGFAGALLHGPAAKALREELSRWHPGKSWKHAEALDRVVGESHAAFPARKTSVVDLALEGEELRLWLKRPAEWWPLCEALRDAKRMLRVRLPQGSGAVSLFKQVARRFPQTHFWIDPFVHGPAEGWQGHVRLAEMENIWLSTLGLCPHAQGLWNETAAPEALHFLVGEVGAGKLFYASGLAWPAAAAGLDMPARQWLHDRKDLEPLELRMTLETTILNLLATPPDDESIF